MPQTKQQTRRSPGAMLRRISPDVWIVLLIFVVAAGLRVYGVGSSLPYVDNPDEPNVVSPAVHMAKTGDLNPHFFQYPALLMYAEAAVFKLNLTWGTLRGYYAGPQSLPDQNYGLALAPGIYVWGRALVALVGAITVAGVYGLGRAMFGRTAGLLAAILLMTSTLHVVNGQHVTADVPMAAMGLAVLAASWRLANRPGWRIVLLAGLLVGLCAATKYNGATVGIVAATGWLLGWLGWRDAHVKQPRPSFVAWVGVAVGMLGVAIAAFMLVNIFILLDWTHWRASFMTQYNGYLPATNLREMWASFTEQVNSLFEGDPAIVVVGIVGSVVMLATLARRGFREARLARMLLLMVPYPFVHIASMSRFQMTYDRNLVILLPFLCLLGGVGLTLLLDVLLARFSRVAPAPLRTTTFPAIVLGLLLTAGPIRDMANFIGYLGMPDSRNLAYSWVRGQLQEGRRVAVELAPWQFCPPDPFGCALPDVFAPGGTLTTQAPAWYAARGYDYVVLLGKDTNLLTDRAEGDDKHSANIMKYSELPQVQHFDGDRQGGKGPYVSVLKVSDGIQSAKAVTRSGAKFGDVAQLYGYAYAPVADVNGHYDPADGSGRLKGDVYRPGNAVGLTLYWQALKSGKEIAANYNVEVRLIAPTGDTVQRLDIGPVSSWHVWPVWEWYRNAYLVGVYNVPLPADLAPGTYHLRVNLYDTSTGQPAGPQPYVDIGAIQVNK